MTVTNGRPAVDAGTVLPEWELPAVSAEKMKTMALVLADPNPIHFDLDSVRELGMGDRPVNQGPNNLAYVMNMLAVWSGGHEHLRGIRVRFRGNVLGGDRVVARGTVSGLRDEAECVLADCDVELVVDEKVVLAGTATVDVTHLTGSAQ
ncbi:MULTISPECIES: MaoC family dehydratase [Prauserella salsuginis group]|uniref:MaoC family dehydratase n=1 Tax=Prauserella salsuginis TaxID=387889 RepID=A0ABW6G4T0_9PSEU|nr:MULTISPECIES: MaoC family dehydratase [Prauserella salsuginis group]MCR3718770.1 Acyl dehydratase [Prauserella flava]MCR3733340.1 Acyl dehydratase [Prauserella salsuginis]